MAFQQQHQSLRDQAFLTSAFSVYAAEVHKAINNQQGQLDQLNAAHEQLQQTINTLEQLPVKLRHQVMVPMGKHAFFPGHLTRTNEIMVHLGDQYYAEVTAGQARGILHRKQAAVAEGISKAQKQLEALHARLDVSAGSLGSATGESEAHEIRSSLAESDALLASASKARKAAAGRKQLVVQQPQQVSSSSGYSYTRPEGPSTPQRTAQQDAEDAALQMRLEQLILLEQQQEMQDSLQQQQHPQQQAGSFLLDTIQEDQQEEAEAEAEAEAAAATRAASHLNAVHHLQQLEAGSDSDDEADPLDVQLQQHPGSQHPPQSPPALAQQAQQLSLQQQQQQQQQSRQGSQQQPKLPLKSALKKGFLGPAVASSSTSKASSTTRSSAGSRQGPSGTETSAAQPLPKPAAFTGTVVERSAVAARAEASAAVTGQVVAERSVSAGPTEPPAADRSSKPMSKFKLRRLGLDRHDQAEAL